jgi:HD superfamily phosphodiesterase
MNIEAAIESAEKKFRQILEEYFNEVWSGTVLISHGIDHHRRVWHYAKELLTDITGSGSKINPELPEKLIIACYMHDIGMSTDRGIRHGIQGVELCRQFLIKYHLDESNYKEVLYAIENHDNKEYVNYSPKDAILTILSVADDLDAFGFIGIFRYSEIYLTRGVAPHLIGYRIRENAERRYINFISVFGYNAELADKHRQRFLILDEFFENYNQESNRNTSNNHDPAGYSGVIEIISEMINNKIPLGKILSGPYRFSKDPVINNFLTGLRKELDHAA